MIDLWAAVAWKRVSKLAAAPRLGVQVQACTAPMVGGSSPCSWVSFTAYYPTLQLYLCTLACQISLHLNITIKMSWATETSRTIHWRPKPMDNLCIAALGSRLTPYRHRTYFGKWSTCIAKFFYPLTPFCPYLPLLLLKQPHPLPASHQTVVSLAL